MRRRLLMAQFWKKAGALPGGRAFGGQYGYACICGKPQKDHIHFTVH